MGVPRIKEALLQLSSQALTDKEVQTLYRMRSVPGLDLLAPSQMFHMPFELRWLVSKNRYSAPGIPMLYCGASVAICWEEIGRPSLDSTWRTGLKVRTVTSAEPRVQSKARV